MNDLIIRKKIQFYYDSISNFSQQLSHMTKRIIEFEADKLKKTMLIVKKFLSPSSSTSSHSFVNLFLLFTSVEMLLEFSFSPVDLCPVIIQMKKLKICHVQVENKTMKNGGNAKQNRRKRKKIMRKDRREEIKEDVYIYYVSKNKMKNIRTNTHLWIYVLLLNDINGES